MRCLLVLRFTALLYLAEAASFFFHFWPSSTSYPCPPRLGPFVSLCLALSSRGGLLLGGLLLGGFFLAVSSWRFRPLLGGKPARPAQPSQRRRRSVLPPVPVHCDRLHLELVAARAREMFCHSQIRLYALPVCGVRFLRPRFSYLLRTCPARPIRAHTCSAITRRLCGWLGASGTQDLRALRPEPCGSGYGLRGRGPALGLKT